MEHFVFWFYGIPALFNLFWIILAFIFRPVANWLKLEDLGDAFAALGMSFTPILNIAVGIMLISKNNILRWKIHKEVV